MDIEFFWALIFSCLTLFSSYLLLQKVTRLNSKFLALISFAIGVISMYLFIDNPAILSEAVSKIVIAAIGVIIGILSKGQSILRAITRGFNALSGTPTTDAPPPEDDEKKRK